MNKLYILMSKVVEVVAGIYVYGIVIMLYCRNLSSINLVVANGIYLACNNIVMFVNFGINNFCNGINDYVRLSNISVM